MSVTEDKNIPPELKQSSTTITSNFLPASLRDLLRCPLLLLLGDICDVELGLLERQDSRLYVIACVVFLQESLRKKRLSQNLSGKNNALPPIENPLSFEQMMLENPDKSRNILKTIKKYLAKHFRRTNTASENKNLNFAAGDKYRAAYLLPQFYEDEINCIYKNNQKIANFDKLSSSNSHSSDSGSTKIKINCGTQTSKMQSSASTSVASLQNLSTQELMEQFILKLRENGEENGNRSDISTLNRKRNAEVQTSPETELNKKTSKMKIINKRISSSMSKILNNGRALNCFNVNLRKAFFTKRQMSKLSVCDADSTISDEENLKLYNYYASSKSVHSTIPRVVYQQRTL